MRIGVISDTHGYLDPRAIAALQGVSLILHAGDIGSAAVVDALEAIAPVTAVQGNVDAGTALGRRYPATQRLTLDGAAIHMTHVGGRPEDLRHALPDPKPNVLIFGHSHVALLEIEDGRASARIVPLI